MGPQAFQVPGDPQRDPRREQRPPLRDIGRILPTVLARPGSGFRRFREDGRYRDKGVCSFWG